LLGGNGNGIEGDTAWNTEVSVILESDLAARRGAEGAIEGDYGILNGRLKITSRQSLVKYELQRY
jgi:hypothetical protein